MSKRYPFESYPWDDNPANNNRWCDAAEVEAHFDALLDLCEDIVKAVAETKVKAAADLNLTGHWSNLHLRLNFYRPKKEKPVSETDEPSKSDKPQP